jgi:hypothetical protein
MDMKSVQCLHAIAATLVLSVSLARGQESPDPHARAGKIANWPAPAFWEPSARGAFEVSGEQVSLGQLGLFAAVTSPLPFIGIEPCRIADTRGNGFSAQAGPPALSANVTRTFQIGGTVPGVPTQCGIPLTAQAVSFQFTIILPSAAGNLIAWPSGPVPSISVLNWPGGIFALGNGIVVPVSGTGGLNIFVNAAFGASAELTIDVNGYYAPAGAGTFNTFVGLNAGNFTMTGDFNTGVGRATLSSNTTGTFNTATGAFALQLNTTGDDNTANGEAALNKNTTGFGNTASGSLALANNTMGVFNTAVGDLALFGNSVGDTNTAIGANALGNTTGFNNIGIGFEGGLNHTVGSNNICIGNPGVVGESSTIRIGTVGIQTATFVAGISGTTSSGGVAVFVNGNGQLGTATSSRRVKEDIREIAEESDDLMRLRPVAFRYKPQIDPTGLAQYGLIAEEVADVYPELVVYDRDGRPETVRYHLINALLLNEVQKQHRAAEAQEKLIEQQKETIDREQAKIDRLEARLERLEARLPADSRP